MTRWLALATPGLRRALVVGAIAALAPAVCGAQTLKADPAREGEALFRGVFFLEGAVAEQVPELRRMKTARALRQLPASQRGTVKTFQDGVISRIQTTSPGFFGQFGACMRGGDRAAIGRCLTNASSLLERVVEQDASLRGSRQKVMAAWPTGSGDRRKGSAEVVVLHPPLTYQWPSVAIVAPTSSSDALFRDKLVNSLATRLKGTR